MTRGAQPADIIRRLKTEGFNMGAHKAYQLARFMVKANIVLVSNLPRELVESMHLHTAANLEDAYREALDIVGSDARVVVCPYAAATLPDLSPQR
jgi:nickel-dependent lactate racemase